MRRICLVVLCLIMLAPGAAAQLRMDGGFTAAKACPAYQSIKKQTNPGDVSTAVGQTYRLIGKNKEPPTHYLVEIPGAGPAERWVAVDCGSVNGAAANTPPSSPAARNDKIQSIQNKPRFVLAIGWQPAFCETRPNKRECTSQTDSRFDASHFTLHGLWPQPRRRSYCGVGEAMVIADEAGQWSRLPEPDITATTRQELSVVMPGMQSLMHRHEWIKHGTCYPAGDAEGYFADAIQVIDAINASPARTLLAANIGRNVSTQEIRSAFDQAFGTGAGQRVRVACVDDGGRRLISEITIGLAGEITPQANLGDLIRASGPTDAGCPGGIIDPVGLQ